MTEFELIRRYFTRATPSALLGVGDDAALLQVSEGNVLAVSSDMLVSGTHFFPDADPFLLGHKTLAVNLSDMAAMGATPRWATLAIALPGADEAWLERFSAGFFALAQQYGVELVGGDTTRGPLNLCVTIFGEVPAQQALRRNGAQVGDEVWVSGTLGDAALALAHLQGRIMLSAAEYTACAPALHQPQPRVALGLALRGIANSAIDISDGLLADLGHILDASQLAAEIDFALLPISAVLQACLTPLSPPLPVEGSLRSSGEPVGVPLAGAGRKLGSSPDKTTSHSTRPSDERLLSGHPKDDSQVAGYDKGRLGGVKLFQQLALSGGDDYELCFSAPGARHAELLGIAARLKLPLTCIGRIVAGLGCLVHDAAGDPLNVEASGYDHFR